jgi:hypothetical protein
MVTYKKRFQYPLNNRTFGSFSLQADVALFDSQAEENGIGYILCLIAYVYKEANSKFRQSCRSSL